MSALAGLFGAVRHLVVRLFRSRFEPLCVFGVSFCAVVDDCLAEYTERSAF